jgi:hypothetical protein
VAGGIVTGWAASSTTAAFGDLQKGDDDLKAA